MKTQDSGIGNFPIKHYIAHLALLGDMDPGKWTYFANKLYFPKYI